MAKDCIICGKRAGSREHVFPASLGGRRTNKGIYCGTHNNSYSSLAAILSKQNEAVNAFLGVRGDHADGPHSVATTDGASGRGIILSNTKSEFAKPEVISDTTSGEQRMVEMRFTSEQEVQEWIKQQRAQGYEVQIGSRSSVQRYYLSDSHISLTLGGPEGLRAIGYVAQTFLAHYFPKVARDPKLAPFKSYTLGQAEGDFVWWDFEVSPELPANAFEFGHRVVIGLDAASGSAYARISLFSALHFAVLFGQVPVAEAGTAVVDIDPLAQSPPKDIVERREPGPVAIVTRPTVMTESLQDTISSGRAERAFGDLLRRIADRNAAIASAAILERIKDAAQLDDAARAKLFSDVLDGESQRILNVMRYVIEGLKKQDPKMQRMAPALDRLVASDPSAANGLSEGATSALELARTALVAQMLLDHATRTLDADRVQMLIHRFATGVT
jgi:hypothetical protein